MNRSAKTSPWEGFPHHQSGLEKRPKQSPVSATSLSFPDKPPGVHQLSSQLESPTVVAPQASVDVHHRQVEGDHFNHYRHYPDLVDSLSVHTVDEEEEEDNIAIHGSQSFAFHYHDQVDLCGTICVDDQLAAFSDSLTKHDPYHNSSFSLPLSLCKPFQRSLTSMQNDLNYEMTTVAITAPNSPLTSPVPNLRHRLLCNPRNSTLRTALQTMRQILRRLVWKKTQMTHVKCLLNGNKIAMRNDQDPGSH